MDRFFDGVDANLRISIENAVPQNSLSQMAEHYKGSNTKQDRLRALAVLLSQATREQSEPDYPSYNEKKQTLEALGLVHAALDDWSHAISAWKGIVDLDDHQTHDNHQKRDLAAMFNLGIALNHTGRYLEAEVTLKRLLPMLEAELEIGKHSQQFAGSLCALMLAVGRQGKVDDARKLYSEHAAIIQHYGEPDCSAHADAAKKILREIERDAREK